MSTRKPGELMTVLEVAELFGVDSKTVTRWALDGKLPEAFRTLGGHRRYRRADVLAKRAETAPRDVSERVL